MSRLPDSLYARLVLLLLVALAASYGTMYVLFLAHLDGARATNISRTVRLVELALAARGSQGLPPLPGLRLATAPPDDAIALDPADRPVVARLTAELGRPVHLLSPVSGTMGVWVNLEAGPGQPGWVFVSTRQSYASRSNYLLESLCVGFAVILAGGMVLLWQLLRPIKAVGEALEAVGRGRPVAPLDPVGTPELQTLVLHFNSMMESLRHGEEDRATMLAGVAHDLRTPITRLRLLAELDETPRSAEVQANLQDIERITEQFLLYARGSGNEPAEERDLSLYLEEVIAPYAAQGVQLRCEGAAPRAPVRPGSLRRALVNLIENAVEYGQAPVCVHVQDRPEGARIAVQDAGPGIPAAQRALALRPFTRLSNSRGGTGHCGLGLVIAERIVRDHGGSLELHGAEPAGLVVEICLPHHA